MTAWKGWLAVKTCRACGASKGAWGYISSSDDTCVACTGRAAGRKTDRAEFQRRLKGSKAFRDTMAVILDESAILKRQGRKYAYLTIPQFIELTEGLRDYPDYLLT